MAFVLIACAAPAGAQGLDDALEELVEEEIESQVEEEIESQVEEEIESQVEEEIESQVEEEIEGQVEEEIGGQIEGQIEAQVESQIEAQVESQIEVQVESTVQDAIERQVESTVAEGIELGIEAEVGESIGVEIGTEIDAEIDADVGIEGDVVEGLGQALDEVIESLTAETRAAARFVTGVDPGNRRAEAEVWVVLVPAQFADRIETWGFTVLERRALEALDRVLLRVEAPGDREIVQAALDLALDAPGTVVDYNHVYESALDEIAEEPAGAGNASTKGDGTSGAPFTIGMIDSIVDPSHSALAGVAIEQQDFVPFSNERPVAHGTAVASIIAGAAGGPAGTSRVEKLHAASVFFKDDDGTVRATTAGLVAAVNWLAGAPDLHVINMSLAGPPNKLLEVALADLAARDIVVVAAVGNNGPAGQPLYPAAYDGVVGVTAVDSSHRVYRYANRGRQVMFSALGVQIQAAAPSGGLSTQSGTSLAAPLVAALIAESMAAETISAAEVLQRIQATALDLGEPQYDEIYGYGLARPVR